MQNHNDVSVTAKRPVLSIIITSYTLDRLKNIYQLMDSIKSQNNPDIEIIYIVERSRELMQYIKDYTVEYDIRNISIFFNDGSPGVSAARNMGIEKANGQILAFIDDDVVLFPDWAVELIKTYADDNVAGVTGPIFPLWQEPSMNWFPPELDWILGCTRWLPFNNAEERSEVRNVNGANASFRKDALAVAGTYSAALGYRQGYRKDWTEFGEETELSMRVTAKTGKTIIFNPLVRVNHYVQKEKAKWVFISQRAAQVGRTRRLIKAISSKSGASDNVLNIEQQLLHRIFFGLFPRIGKTMLSKPGAAWNQFRAVMIVLFFVALGYGLYGLPGIKVADLETGKIDRQFTDKLLQ